MTDIMATLVDWLLKFTLLLAGAMGLAQLLRRSAAASRYRMWTATLALALVGPAAAHWLTISLPILPSVPEELIRTAIPAKEASILDRRPGLPSGNRVVPPAGKPSPLLAVVVVWAAVAVVLMARLAWSIKKVRRLIARGQRLADSRWQALLYDTADRIGLDPAPVLLMSDDMRIPLACRVRHPAIVLPSNANDWTEERRRFVLLHEMAHIKRRDLLGHTLGRLACAVYWFHPLVWLGARQLRAESEKACDDLAVTSGAKPEDYAQELLTMLAELRPDNRPAAAMAMATNREFEGRIISILDSAVPRESRGPLRTVGPAMTMLIVGLGVAITHPTPREAQALPPPAAPSAVVAPLRDTTLRRLLQADPSAAVRRAAAWSLHQSRGSASALLTALRADPDARVREMAAWALGQQGDSGSLPAIYSRLRSETDDAVRATIAWAIGQSRGREHAELFPLLGATNPDVVMMALWAIGQNPPRSAPAPVRDHLAHPDRNVRQMAAWSLGETGDAGAVPQLLAALNSEPDSEVRRFVLRALFESGDRSSTLIQASLRSPDPDVRERGVQIAGGQKARPWAWPLPLPDPRSIP
jgi:beta-lactamase regulating signal transducer with metallopeptidase domain